MCLLVLQCIYLFVFKQKTAYEMRISDWSSDVCSSDLDGIQRPARRRSQQCRYPEAMRVVAMAQHARVPRQLAEWRVADAPEHGGGLRIGKAVDQVAELLAGPHQCTLQR